MAKTEWCEKCSAPHELGKHLNTPPATMGMLYAHEVDDPPRDNGQPQKEETVFDLAVILARGGRRN